MLNEDWKLNGESPTLEDCKKYRSCKTTFLGSHEMYNGIYEIRIRDVSKQGLVEVNLSHLVFWAHPSDLKIVELLAPKQKSMMTFQEAQTIMQNERIEYFAIPVTESRLKRFFKKFLTTNKTRDRKTK